jgi:hypothetical protein
VEFHKHVQQTPKVVSAALILLFQRMNGGILATPSKLRPNSLNRMDVKNVSLGN